ncbi:MAG: single-stranded-DNA-specific exonuclease RecJ [Rhodopila sp.]
MTDDLVLGVRNSLCGRRWLWRAGEARVAAGIAQRLELPEIVSRMLAARGVGIDAAVDFLEPTLRVMLPDPSVLVDMDIAADRLADAVCRQETVAVFGDYDVDGACSAALMLTLLRELGCPVHYHVPDRILEGYGPNAPALEGLVGRGASLIICVDCGTAAALALSAVAGRADVIVLDHHKIEDAPPSILATVNPNRLDDRSGLTHLCAAGVSFLTAIATVRALRRVGFFSGRSEPNLMALLDLVALATVCDVMPLTGVNRAFVCQGLKVMARRSRPGIAALLDVTQAREKLNASTCGYALGPRINAGGRISEADLGLRLLLSEDRVEALILAERLEAVNRMRQDVEAGIMQAAMTAAEAQITAGRAAILVTGQGWHPGVVGIVAGRIKERFNRPACVAGFSDGLGKGSGRSVAGVDLGAAVIAARQVGLLVTGGGHAMAAGFSLQADQLDAFHAFLDERLAAAAAMPSAADLVVEGTLAVSGATTEVARHLEQLAPFGAGNEEPTLVLHRARVVRADRVGR